MHVYRYHKGWQGDLQRENRAIGSHDHGIPKFILKLKDIDHRGNGRWLIPIIGMQWIAIEDEMSKSQMNSSPQWMGKRSIQYIRWLLEDLKIE